MKKIDIKLENKYLSPNNTTAYLEFVVEEDFDFLPGQFAMLDNGQIKRPYSFASSPALAKSEKKVCFYVKKVSENGMSKYLVEDISVGNKLSMMGPFGHMTLDSAEEYLLISIGSGFAPMLSIMEDLFLKGSKTKVYNVFGERYIDNIPEKILEKLNNMPQYFYHNIVLSRQEDFSFVDKRENIKFSKGHVQDILPQIVGKINKENLKVYICGKPAMVDEIVDFLTKNNIPLEAIKFEKY